MTEKTRENGTVKWFDNAKGYGFLLREDGSEVFVHHRSITKDGYRSLVKGQAVSFRVVDGEKGLSAEDVTELHHSSTPSSPEEID